MEKNAQIPTFASQEEEAAFWETHSFADFEDALGEVQEHPASQAEVAVILKDAQMTMRLTAQQYDALRAEANKRGIGPSTLARMWVLERLAAAQHEAS